MFEAEYARRRTTAEAEAGASAPGTPSIWRAAVAPSGLCRRPPPAGPAELHGVRVLNYLPLEPLALLTDPACGDALSN